MSTKYEAFTESAKSKSADAEHRAKLQKAMGTYHGKVSTMQDKQFRDWDAARDYAEAVKSYAIENMPDLLEQFEAKQIDRGSTVLWAETAEDARTQIAEIVHRHKVESVVKSKSMTSEEIRFNEFMDELKVDVIESDLGELIVQMRGEKPYHIVTPAMHLSKEDIAELFHEKLGTALDASVEDLTAAARLHLREKFLAADMGFTSANFILADDGSFLVLENEGNARLSANLPDVHVAVIGIDKVLANLKDLSLFLPLLSTSGTGQQMTVYNSIFRGPRAGQSLYVILLDNGRSDLYADEKLREVLRCIRCGACLNSCPVYESIGGHSYEAAYSGPIGSVISPHIFGFQDYQHLSQSSSLCGACTDVCPVKIPLHHLLHYNRTIANETKTNDASWRLIMRLWAKAMKSRNSINIARNSFGIIDSIILKAFFQKHSENLPKLAEKSFAELWEEKNER